MSLLQVKFPWVYSIDDGIKSYYNPTLITLLSSEKEYTTENDVCETTEIGYSNKIEPSTGYLLKCIKVDKITPGCKNVYILSDSGLSYRGNSYWDLIKVYNSLELAKSSWAVDWFNTLSDYNKSLECSKNECGIFSINLNISEYEILSDQSLKRTEYYIHCVVPRREKYDREHKEVRKTPFLNATDNPNFQSLFKKHMLQNLQTSKQDLDKELKELNVKVSKCEESVLKIDNEIRNLKGTRGSLHPPI